MSCAKWRHGVSSAEVLLRHKRTELSPSVGVSNALELFLGLDTSALQSWLFGWAQVEEKCWKVEMCIKMDPKLVALPLCNVSFGMCCETPRTEKLQWQVWLVQILLVWQSLWPPLLLHARFPKSLLPRRPKDSPTKSLGRKSRRCWDTRRLEKKPKGSGPC